MPKKGDVITIQVRVLEVVAEAGRKIMIVERVKQPATAQADPGGDGSFAIMWGT